MEILLLTQRENSVPMRKQLMAPADPFSREDVRKPKSQFEGLGPR